MSKLDHTLAATWNKPTGGTKTVTGCVVGQPIFFIHKNYSDSAVNAYIELKPTAGCVHASSSTSGHYAIGTPSWDDAHIKGCTNVLVVIPNATSVTISFGGSNDGGDDIIYVYKT